MAGSHVHALYLHRPGGLHAAEPHVKLAATLLFVLAVVATPREAFWAFGAFAGMLAVATAAARVPPGFVARRMIVEIPFLLFAFFLPIVGQGERVEVLGWSLSQSGLWAAWNILAKATLGLLTSIVLAGTTEIPQMLRGFEALRVPRVLTSIMGFMIRYLDVVLGEFRRMRIAMKSRGHNPTWIGQLRPYANSAGMIFVRSYERGERVYLAMASRGFDGQMPRGDDDSATAREWGTALVAPLTAWTIAVIAWVTL